MAAFDNDVSHPRAASGTVDDLNRRFGRQHLSAIGTCLVYSVSAMVTAMVAVAVGEYAGALLNSSNKATSGALAAGIIVAMMAVSIWGARAIGRARGLIVVVVVGMLAVLAAWSHVIASAVPAFVGLLGLGTVALTARHLTRPASQLPRPLWSQPFRAGDLGRRPHVGLLVAAAVSLIIELLFNLTAIAAIGGALRPSDLRTGHRRPRPDLSGNWSQAAPADSHDAHDRDPPCWLWARNRGEWPDGPDDRDRHRRPGGHPRCSSEPHPNEPTVRTASACRVARRPA
jgi:hypothetical protein